MYVRKSDKWIILCSFRCKNPLTRVNYRQVSKHTTRITLASKWSLNLRRKTEENTISSKCSFAPGLRRFFFLKLRMKRERQCAAWKGFKVFFYSPWHTECSPWWFRQQWRHIKDRVLRKRITSRLKVSKERFFGEGGKIKLLNTSLQEK